MSGQHAISCAAVGGTQGNVARAGLRALFTPAAAIQVIYSADIYVDAVFIAQRNMVVRHAPHRLLTTTFARATTIAVAVVI